MQGLENTRWRREEDARRGRDHGPRLRDSLTLCECVLAYCVVTLSRFATTAW